MAAFQPWPGAENAEDWGARSAWEEIYVNGLVLPGLATLSGFLSRKLDLKESAGTNGASVKHLGYQPARIEITLRLWTDFHLAEWQDRAAELQPRPSAGSPRAVSIAHPALDIHGVRKVFVEKIGLLQPTSTAGVFETKLSLVEVTKSKSKGAPDADVNLAGETSFDSKLPTVKLARDSAKPSKEGAGKP